MFLWSIDGLYLWIFKWKQRKLRLQGLFVNFCFQAVLKIRRDGEGLESGEPLTFTSFPFPPTQAFLSSKDTLTCRPVVIVTQHFVTEIRETNDRSQLILVLTKANANDKLCILLFCTMFQHCSCCKLTSALRYRALFWRVQVINKRCRFHYVQWSYWFTWMINASLIGGLVFLVTLSLLSRSLKI